MSRRWAARGIGLGCDVAQQQAQVYGLQHLCRLSMHQSFRMIGKVSQRWLMITLAENARYVKLSLYNSGLERFS